MIPHKPTEAALRAARQIERNPSLVEATAEIIDRETDIGDLADILEQILAEARNWPCKLVPPCGGRVATLQDRPNNTNLPQSQCPVPGFGARQGTGLKRSRLSGQ